VPFYIGIDGLTAACSASTFLFLALPAPRRHGGGGWWAPPDGSGNGHGSAAHKRTG
jgi:hypothetical protein